jgi:Site-specific recombinase XerD
MLYKDVLYKWVEVKRIEIRKSSIQNYLQCIRNWIVPVLGNTPIENITKEDLQKFIINFAANHKRNTIINISKPLSGSFKWAEENKIICVNPWKNIKIPQDFSEREICVFSQEEIRSILASVSGYKKDIILLGYRTGMRIGEILTLKWEDVNFAEEFLTIRRTLSGYGESGLEITIPKTKRSRRRIELDRITLEMLKNRYNKKEMYVFSKEDGSIYSRQCINLPKICSNDGIKPRSFHTLRHTHATILLSAGVHAKIVQERLGHAKISTTLDTYSHLVPGMQKAAVDIFNNIV